MLGWRLFSSLLLWGIILTLVTLRYTHGVFLLIAIVGVAAQREFYLSQRSAGRTVFLKRVFWRVACFMQRHSSPSFLPRADFLLPFREKRCLSSW